MYIKGADSIIKSRLKPGNQPYLERLNNSLMEFSKKGLRTLLLAMKVIDESVYQEFAAEYQKSLGNKDE